MKRLPKYTPAEVRNDPYGFTYKEMSEVIGENEAKALYEELYKQLPRKKNLSMLVKNICKSSDTEKYVYELKDNKYIETVFIKRRDGGTVCVSTQVGCPVGCIFCESGRNGFVRNLTSSEIVQQIILLRRKVNRIVFMGMGEGGADKILDYADRPSFCLYSSGLSPPRDILIRFSRYQTI